MKIICSVEVLNRTLPSLNMTSKKGIRSSLTIGKSTNKEISIFHQTSQNTCGNKYKINNNIENVFTKFVSEGKATIRFKEPQHDLAIKCDPIQLKGFLRTLKLTLEGAPSSQLSTIQPNALKNKTLKPVKKKWKITKKEEYPVLEGFSRTIENLCINHINQKLFDNRILRLRNLSILNLRHNNLTTLPEQLGSSLPNLTELYLGDNSLGLSKDWRWIANDKLQKQLRLLDLHLNKIDVLPDKVVKLQKLVTLSLDNNNLHAIPNGIGCMKELRYFSASNNVINYLPGSIFLLKLVSIDISGNQFSTHPPKKLSFSDFQVLPSLLDIAAASVISNRLQYSKETLPQTLIEHLDSAYFCRCGNPCFSTQPHSYIRYHSSASIVVHSCNNGFYVVAVRYCSQQCYVKQQAQM